MPSLHECAQLTTRNRWQWETLCLDLDVGRFWHPAVLQTLFVTLLCQDRDGRADCSTLCVQLKYIKRNRGRQPKFSEAHTLQSTHNSFLILSITEMRLFSLSAGWCWSVGFLLLPPTARRHACQVNLQLKTVHRWEYECEWSSVHMYISTRVYNPASSPLHPGTPQDKQVSIMEKWTNTSRYRSDSKQNQNLSETTSGWFQSADFVSGKLMRVTPLTTFSLCSSRLTCQSPPAPGTTAPWLYAAARRSSTPRRSVPTTADRSLCCRRAGSWQWGPRGRQRRAGWGRPCRLPLCWPVRWTGTPGLPWDKKEIRILSIIKQRRVS